MNLRFHPRQIGSTPRQGEQGYVLIWLLLTVAMLAMFAAAIAPTIAFQIKRDREEEMVHRGVQYSRAIRRYVKKFGRYPTRIEDLENTNNMRFLRKKYKDPITGKDFKLLHQGDVQVLGMAGIQGAMPAANMPGATQFGQTNPLSTSGGGAKPNQTGPGANPDDSQSGGEDKSAGDTSDSGDKLSGQVFGGGPILGVASASKATTIRQFNNKSHYNQWQFIYDPTSDRGGLITTPYQPPLQMTNNLQQQNTGTSGSSFQPNQPNPNPGSVTSPNPVQ